MPFVSGKWECWRECDLAPFGCKCPEKGLDLNGKYFTIESWYDTYRIFWFKKEEDRDNYVRIRSTRECGGTIQPVQPTDQKNAFETIRIFKALVMPGPYQDASAYN